MQIESYAADTDFMPFLQGFRRDGGGIEGYNGAASLRAYFAEGVQHAGVVVSVDGGLDEDHVLDSYCGIETQGLGESVRCWFVTSINRQRVVVWIHYVHVTVP